MSLSTLVAPYQSDVDNASAHHLTWLIASTMQSKWRKFTCRLWIWWNQDWLTNRINGNGWNPSIQWFITIQDTRWIAEFLKHKRHLRLKLPQNRSRTRQRQRLRAVTWYRDRSLQQKQFKVQIRSNVNVTFFVYQKYYSIHTHIRYIFLSRSSTLNTVSDAHPACHGLLSTDSAWRPAPCHCSRHAAASPMAGSMLSWSAIVLIE